MSDHPPKTRLTPALAADLALAAAALVALARAAERGFACAVLAVAVVLALVRWGRRPRRFVVDEAAGVLRIDREEVPLARVAVGPRTRDGRRFRLYDLDERVRTYTVDARYVRDAAGLHALLARRGAKVIAVYDPRQGLAWAIAGLLPATCALAGVALGFESAGLYEDPIPVFLFGGLAAAFALLDAAGVEGASFVVDPAGRRAWWFAWYRAHELGVAPPRVSTLGAPDVVLKLGRSTLRLRPDQGDILAVKAAIAAIAPS